MNRFQLPIVSKKMVAKDAMEISLGIPGTNFNFSAGQYIRLVLPKMAKNAEPRGNGREFSIASSPSDKKCLTIVFRLTDSIYKRTLVNYEIGETLEVEGPYGNMVIPKNDSSIVFIAGGTGIAPIISMIRWISEQKLSNKMLLLYADQSEESAIYLKELAQISGKNKNFRMEKIIGLITQEVLENHIKGEKKSLFYIAGGPAMTDNIVRMLDDSGVPEKQIYFEESDLLLYPDHNILASIIERSLEGIFISDLRGILKYANKTWCQLSGWESKEVINKFTPRLIKSGKYDKEFYDNFWSKILAGKTFRYDFINKRKDGGLYYVDEVTMPFKSVSGVIIGFITFQRDIGDRIRLENQLREYNIKLEGEVRERTEQLLSKVLDLENSSKAAINILEDLNQEKKKLAEEKAKDDAILKGIGDGLIISDKAGKIMMVNKKFEELLGLTQEEIIGKYAAKIIPAEDEAGNAVPLEERSISKVLSGNGRYLNDIPAGSFNLYYLRKNKTRFPVSSIVTPFDIGGEVIGAVEVFRDVTREKEINRAKTEFISIVSHQLRTPLSAFKWVIELLLEDRGLTPKQREQLGYLNKSNERLIALVNDLFSVYRVESGRLIKEKQLCDIGELINSTIKLFNLKLKQRKQKIVLSVSPKIRKAIISGFLFTEAFNNILSNAVDYSLDNSVITVKLEDDADYYTISINNMGLVISEADRDKIFTKFFRGAEALKLKPEGSGLGLFIAKSAVEENGGKIWFDSDSENGTTFRFTVPRDRV